MSSRTRFLITRFATFGVVAIAFLTLIAPVALSKSDAIIVEPAAIVNTGRLNVRSGPSRSYSLVTTVDRRQGLPILGRNADSTWIQLRLAGGYTGWVDANFVQSDMDPAKLPVTFDSAAVPIQPNLTLSDGVANPGKSISVLAEGYGPNQQVVASLYTPDLGMKQTLASAVTDASGNAQLDLVMPSFWGNGDPIEHTNIVLVVGTPDGLISETSNLQYVFGKELVTVPSLVDEAFRAFHRQDVSVARSYLTGRALGRTEFSDEEAFQNLTGLTLSADAITGIGSRVIQVRGNQVRAETVLIFGDLYARFLTEFVVEDGQYLIQDLELTGQYWAEDVYVVG